MDGSGQIPIKSAQGATMDMGMGSGTTGMALPPPYEAVDTHTSPTTAIGSGLDAFHPFMNFVTSSLYFQQPSAADINRMTMFQIVNDQGQLLFTCTLNRIPKAGEIYPRGGIRLPAYKTEYTVSDTAGRTVLVALADGSNISVTTGDRISIGFINGSVPNSSFEFRWHSQDVDITYTGTTIDGMNTFKVQESRAVKEFVIEYNGAVGVMKRRLPSGPIAHAKSFGIKFPANEMDPQTKALIFATGLNVYDNNFLPTTHGEEGVRGAQVAKEKKLMAIVGGCLLAMVLIYLLVFLFN